MAQVPSLALDNFWLLGCIPACTELSRVPACLGALGTPTWMWPQFPLTCVEEKALTRDMMLHFRMWHVLDVFTLPPANAAIPPATAFFPRRRETHDAYGKAVRDGDTGAQGHWGACACTELVPLLGLLYPDSCRDDAFCCGV